MKFIKKIIRAIINLFKKAWNDVKELGWVGGTIVIVLSTVIFYSPTIVLFILYLITKNGLYLSLSIGYVVWWFSPAFSPALIVWTTIIISMVKLFRYIQRRDNFNKEATK